MSTEAVPGKYEEAERKLERVRLAQIEYARFTQKQVDQIFAHVAQEMMQHRLTLAKLAVEETRLGLVEDKAVKNAYACEYVYNAYKDIKTVGVLRHDPVKGIDEIACPVGPIAAICPTTNPTSTVIVKSLMALKSGNAVLHLPHPRAKKCSSLAAKLVHDAAVAAGAPEGIVECIEEVSLDVTDYVLKHPHVRFILATGGGNMVKASYSSGKPALGVGAGNAPVLVDESANPRQAVASIVLGKTFDNGTICASEQSTVIVAPLYDEMKRLFQERGVYFVEGENRTKLGNFLMKNGMVNPDIVGQSAKDIAKKCGFEVPSNTVVLGAEAELIGPEEPFSHEKLSPVLTLYRAANWDDGLDKAVRIAKHGGAGHTAVLYTDEARNRDRITAFELAMPACHLIVNMPSSAGAIGLAYNFNVDPSLTIGVGSDAGSSTSSNVTPAHLINVKKLAVIREHIEWFKVPHMYFNRNCTREALSDLLRPHQDGTRDRRAFVVTDRQVRELGYVDELRTYLRELHIDAIVFSEVTAAIPTMDLARRGAQVCETARPDVIIALGGGKVIDAAKMIRLLYENPTVELKDLSGGFLEIRQRTAAFPELGSKVRRVITIPTSGVGAEVSPWVLVTDSNGVVRPVCSYSLTPEIAIIDARYTDEMPKEVVARAGFTTLAHAVDAAVSVFASDFTMPLCKRACKLVYGSLVESFESGSRAARENMHHASAIAGMAYSNAFLGITHSMAHALCAQLGVPHGVAKAAVFDVVVRYNSDPSPTRMAAFPQYQYPQSLERYAALATTIGIPKASEREMVEAFITRTAEVRRAIGLPTTIKEAGISEAALMAKVDAMAEMAFGDQCTGTNPRYPLISELRELFIQAFHGNQPKLTH